MDFVYTHAPHCARHIISLSASFAQCPEQRLQASVGNTVRTLLTYVEGASSNDHQLAVVAPHTHLCIQARLSNT